MSLSEDLFAESQRRDTTVMRLEQGRMLKNDGFEREVSLEKNAKNVYNCNNDVYNIYDDKGNCFATADAVLVNRLAEKYWDLKRDEALGVELSNGLNFSYQPDAEQWKIIQGRGKRNTNARYLSQENASNKIAALRGTAQQTPTAVKKTEMNHEMSAQMMKRGAER